MCPVLRACTRVIVAALLSVSIASCSQGWRKLSSDEVLQILPEFTLLTANLADREVPDSVRLEAYRVFFDRRGISMADWDSTMSWYAKNRVTLYRDLYRLTADSLTRVQERLQAEQDRVDREAEYERKLRGALLDSVNLLLEDSLQFYAPGELINRTFALVPTVAYDSTVRVSLRAELMGLPRLTDDSLRLELRLHLRDSTSRIVSRSIGASGGYELSLEVPDGKQAIRVSGYLRGMLPLQPDRARPIVLDRLSLIKYPREAQGADSDGSMIRTTDQASLATSAEEQNLDQDDIL